jgi:DNA invertase Pin-like site-specific DNA recombinase
MVKESIKYYDKTVELSIYDPEEVIKRQSLQIDALLYGRLSQDEIKTRSLSKLVQRAEGLKICAMKGWKNVVVCIEKLWAKGDNFGRIQLQEALSLIRTKRVRRILARDEERLWRGTQAMNQVLDAVSPFNVELHTFSKELQYRTADGRFQIEVMAALAGQRPRKDAENIRRIIEKNWQMGFTHGSPAYGYTSQTREVSKLLAPFKEELYKGRRPDEIDEEDLIMINNQIDQRKNELLVEVSKRYPLYKHKYLLDDEAEMVVLCFHCYVNLLWGADRITSYLNDEKGTRESIPFQPDKILKIVSNLYGKTWDEERVRTLLERRVFKTRLGKPWYTETIRKILLNPVYAGWAHYDKHARETYTKPHSNKMRHEMNKNAKHDPITTEECFLKGVEIRKRNLEKLRSKLLFHGEPIKNPKAYPASIILFDELGRHPNGKSAGSRKNYGYYHFNPIRHGTNRRPALSINNREVDRAIVEGLQRWLEAPDTIMRVVEEHNKKNTLRKPDAGELNERLSQERADYEKKQAKFIRLLEESDDSDVQQLAKLKIQEFTAMLNEVKSKIDSVAGTRIACLEKIDPEEGKRYLKNLGKFLAAKTDRLAELYRLLKAYHNLNVLVKDKENLILSLEVGCDGKTVLNDSPSLDGNAVLVYPTSFRKDHAVEAAAHHSARSHPGRGARNHQDSFRGGHA